MTIDAIAALLFRMLGMVSLLLGLFAIAGMAITYVSLAHLRDLPQMHDTYYVVGNSILPALLLISGALFMLFSKPLGRLLARGLQ